MEAALPIPCKEALIPTTMSQEAALSKDMACYLQQALKASPQLKASGPKYLSKSKHGPLAPIERGRSRDHTPKLLEACAKPGQEGKSNAKRSKTQQALKHSVTRSPSTIRSVEKHQILTRAHDMQEHHVAATLWSEAASTSTHQKKQRPSKCSKQRARESSSTSQSSDFLKICMDR